MDPDAFLLEMELTENEEEDPHGDVDIMDHCTVAMNAQPFLGYDGAEMRATLELTKGEDEIDMVEKPKYIEDGWVTVNRKSDRHDAVAR